MSDQNYALPFDPNANAATNFIKNEQQILTPPNWNDYYFVIPEFAPFYAVDLKLTHQPSGRVLDLGIDYNLTHKFNDATVGTAKAVYGSITFLDNALAGSVSLEYRSVGGPWTLSQSKILEILTDTLLNPRITTWEQVAGMPIAFPPIDHQWHLDDLIGMSEVVDAVTYIAEALGGEGGAGDSHLGRFDNPHQVTKSQVGLGNVQNLPIATQQDALDGLSNSVYMTALRTKQLVVDYTSLSVSGHAQAKNNPHEVSAAQVGLGNVPNFEMADSAEMLEGLRNDLFTSPERVAEYVAIVGQQMIDVHGNLTNNPHNTTANQVGAYSKSEADALLANYLLRDARATDSAALEGLSLQEVQNQIAIGVGESYTLRLTAPSDTNSTDWILLFSIGDYDPLLNPAVITEPAYNPGVDLDGNVVRNPELIFTIAGHGRDHDHDSVLEMVRVSTRNGNAESVTVVGEAGKNTTSQIGVLSQEGGGIHVFLKSVNERSTTSVSILSPGDFDFSGDSSYNVEPNGIEYITSAQNWNNITLPRASTAEMDSGSDVTKYLAPKEARESVDKSLNALTDAVGEALDTGIAQLA